MLLAPLDHSPCSFVHIGVAKSKMYFPEKPEILKGRGVQDFGILRAWGGGGGVTHFGISEGKGGLKHGSRPLLGMDIFWNCPIHIELWEEFSS